MSEDFGRIDQQGAHGVRLWGFPTVRHNEIRDLIAELLTEVCHNVAVEPTLLPLSGEAFTGLSTNTSENARADVRAAGFWTRGKDAYFDMKVFYPDAPLYKVNPNRQPASLNSMSGVSGWNVRNGLSTSTVGPSLRWCLPQQAQPARWQRRFCNVWREN